jgi:hypothetical protein
MQLVARARCRGETECVGEGLCAVQIGLFAATPL